MVRFQRSTLLAMVSVLAAASAALAQPRQAPRIPRSERSFQTPDVSRAMARALDAVAQVQSRVRLGVRISADRAPTTDSIGARIDGVLPDSPADEAGLEAGDIIVALDGRSLLQPLEDEALSADRSAPAQRLLRLAGRLDPRDTVRISYRRGPERREATIVARDVAVFDPMIAPKVRIESMPKLRADLERMGDDLARLRFRWQPTVFGLEIVDLNAQLGEYFGTDRGVLVTQVDTNSPLPLQAGDVILEVGGRQVRDADHLREILSSYRSDERVVMSILRKQQRTTVEGLVP
ncbi:MAG: PDZ domain-containing protein [Gemmatimonadetes bacterium]|nr:PDZ domain-containing protein [Gemmatimonadota bacterium]